MPLKTTPVSQCLDKRLLILGFEIPDLLLIFAVLSVLNFVLGPFGHRFFVVWLPSLLLAATLWFGKQGKPDNYLVHLIRYHASPKLLTAFEGPTVETPAPRLSKQFSQRNHA